MKYVCAKLPQSVILHDQFAKQRKLFLFGEAAVRRSFSTRAKRTAEPFFAAFQHLPGCFVQKKTGSGTAVPLPVRQIKNAGAQSVPADTDAR